MQIVREALARGFQMDLASGQVRALTKLDARTELPTP
jgi:hypothetical protein